MQYDRTQHAAAHTQDFGFNQLIPYLGNKRKLLPLIERAVALTDPAPGQTFVDLFAGSGVVSRWAKQQQFRVLANDWEPYTDPINTAAIACNTAPAFAAFGGYPAALDTLNALPDQTGWVTNHLCPRDDDRYDVDIDRMFYTRRNGQRIDAIREQILQWRADGSIDATEEACLLAPLIYQACYRANTSGVFKGFHKGWGGQTSTALYRIAEDLKLTPCIFHDNRQPNRVTRTDAQQLAADLAAEGTSDLVYLDPPYNQHPYASNYHVLNSIALWDKPDLPEQITPGTKAGIRTDWRTDRRSDYNYRRRAADAYRTLLDTLDARSILTSYSTDGMIRLEDLVRANCECGHTRVELQHYKRYRVSRQRFSRKPMNVEFVLICDTTRRGTDSADMICATLRRAEGEALADHPEGDANC
jgi:adenine-specific DNA-methyltransferase